MDRLADRIARMSAPNTIEHEPVDQLAEAAE
jgi:hypothetical protein